MSTKISTTMPKNNYYSTSRPNMRVCFFSFLIFIFAHATTSLHAQTLIWEDEFNSGLGNWNIQTGDGCDIGICGWGNNELQWYQASNVSTQDGKLLITAKKEAQNGYNYTSGRINTKNKFDFTYGRIEASVKLVNGKGLWSALWMLPTDNVYGTWAASGEIDILEAVNLGTRGPDKIHQTLHYGGEWPNNVSSGCSTSISGAASGFNIVALEWEPAEFRWYLNDSLICTQKNWHSAGGAFPAPFDQDFHLLVNLAVGGNWPGSPDNKTQFPATMEIDYIRVYKLPDNNEANEIIVDSVVTGTHSAGKGSKYGKATITLKDNTGAPAAGAVVSGEFSGTWNESVSGITDSNGKVIVLTGTTNSGNVDVNFCVNSVTSASLPFNSTASNGMCP